LSSFVIFLNKKDASKLQILPSKKVKAFKTTYINN